MGILPHHENMIAVLAVDEVKVKRIDDEDHVNWIAVNGGIVEVADNLIPSLQTLLNALVILTSVVLKEQNYVPSVPLKKHRKSI